jgi:hypothetical protein
MNLRLMQAEDVVRLTSIDENVTPKWMGTDFFQLSSSTDPTKACNIGCTKMNNKLRIASNINVSHAV